MSVSVLLELKVAPGKLADVKSYMESLLPVTREYPGFISMDVFVNQDDQNDIVCVEEWESRNAYETYFNWRAENGVFEKLATMIAAEPRVRFLDNTNI